MNFTTLRRVAPAQTLPRGEPGPEAGDGSVAQTCSSVLPPPEPTAVSAGFVFSKTEYWDQLPELVSESKREDATARFGAGASLLIFCRIPCSAYTTKYPIPAGPVP